MPLNSDALEQVLDYLNAHAESWMTAMTILLAVIGVVVTASAVFG
jgi:hypothetical protein